MEIHFEHFDLTIDEFLGDVQMARARFVDAAAGDNYTIRFQRTAGVLDGRVDCIAKLNGKDAWQVQRSQDETIRIGTLLLKIASAPVGTVAREFFA